MFSEDGGCEQEFQVVVEFKNRREYLYISVHILTTKSSVQLKVASSTEISRTLLRICRKQEAAYQS